MYLTGFGSSMFNAALINIYVIHQRTLIKVNVVAYRDTTESYHITADLLSTTKLLNNL